MKRKAIIKLGYWHKKTDIKGLFSGKSSTKKVFEEIKTIESNISLSDIEWLLKLVERNGIQAIYNKINSKSIPEWLHENEIYLSMNEIIQAALVRQKFHKNNKNLRKDSLMYKYRRMLKHKTKEEVLQEVIKDKKNNCFSSRHFYNIKAMINAHS